MQHQEEKTASIFELVRYFKAALADKNNISFENAECIRKYFAKDGIPEEVFDDAYLWLDCFEEECVTVLTEDIENMPLFINSLGIKINGDWKKLWNACSLQLEAHKQRLYKNYDKLPKVNNHNCNIEGMLLSEEEGCDSQALKADVANNSKVQKVVQTVI